MRPGFKLIEHETVDGLAVYELPVKRPIEALSHRDIALKDAS
jgi:hypothetical protein